MKVVRENCRLKRERVLRSDTRFIRHRRIRFPDNESHDSYGLGVGLGYVVLYARYITVVAGSSTVNWILSGARTIVTDCLRIFHTKMGSWILDRRKILICPFVAATTCSRRSDYFDETFNSPRAQDKVCS